MILTAHQPVYLPWLGLFQKIAMADEFCVFDIAQYQTKDFNNRNKIKTPQGPIWLSVPVESKNHFEKSVGEIRIHNNGWHKKHYRSIEQAYRKAPFFSTYIGEIEELLMKVQYEKLSDLNWAWLKFGMQCFGLTPRIHMASKCELEGKKSDLVLDMCVKLGADLYVFGAQGRNYAQSGDFAEAGVAVHFQDYVHPTYPQLYGEFVPNMAFIDLLFNVGPEVASDLLTAENPTRDSLAQEHSLL